MVAYHNSVLRFRSNNGQINQVLQCKIVGGNIPIY